MSGTIASNIAHIHSQIADACQLAGRVVNQVMLLAVSKTVNAAQVAEAVVAGQCGFGENYVQEGVEKICALREMLPQADLQWHLIGPLQSNKTRIVAEHFDWVQTIDRLKIAQRLSEQRPAHLPPLQVCIQVNVDDAPSKAGVALGEVLPLALEISRLPRLRLRGLMSMPDAQPTAEATQALHASARDCLQALNQHPHFAAQPLDTLSMGMSADMAPAIAAGSTMVRIGTAIFGNRKSALGQH